MKKFLIYGAGAIGRGYLPWVFPDAEYFFVEANPALTKLLREKKKYTTYMTVDGAYQSREVHVADCFLPGEETAHVAKMDGAFTAVGPRNLLSLADPLRGTKIPVVCFENDSSLPRLLSSATGNPNIVFGVPDVITSSTASRELLQKDELAIITENGTCIVDERVRGLGGACSYVSTAELKKQWQAKLYLHNTPHCVAAYLGALLGVEYVHDAMANPKAQKIVQECMREMQQMLSRRTKIEASFLDWYAGKELVRFSNKLLCDPIARVAREPFRKLGLRDRLIGAAELCLSAGIYPQHLLTGIMSAFCYDNPKDPDAGIAMLLRALGPRDFMEIIIGLAPQSALFTALEDRWQENTTVLRAIKESSNA